MVYEPLDADWLWVALFPCDPGIDFDLRDVADGGFDFIHDAFCFAQVAAGSRLYVNIDRAHVFLRNEAGFGGGD